MRTFFNIDVQGAAARVACPALLLHARADRRSPLEEGRILASLIPGARLVPLNTENHILLSHEPAFDRFFAELEAFVAPQPGGRPAFDGLTAREAQILERIAQGLDNAQIAAHLGMSEKTVRNHITHVFDKIGVENRSQAIVLARERGLGQQSRPS
jgi:DNA-binding CsgD family transcriptional regulator